MNIAVVPHSSLEAMNSALAPAERDRIKDFDRPKQRPVIIVGAPRSGHTVFSQILAATGAFGYITNFTARFWDAPVLGAELQRSLGPINEEVTFVSKHGRISGWSAPHEGGNFLRRLIKFSDNHVADRNPSDGEISEWRQEIAALEDFHGKNILLRNIIYGFNLPIVFDALPNALIVVVRRDPLFQAQSIYEARSEHGDPNVWWSARPANFDSVRHLAWPDQIAGQIAGCYETLAKMQEQHPGSFLNLAYEDICRSPEHAISQLFVSAEIARSSNPIPPLRSTNQIRISDQAIGDLRGALQTAGLI